MGEHRVLVCGGRNYNRRRTVYVSLDGLAPKPTVIIHGDYYGADDLAKGWANLRGVPEAPFPADWQTHGRAAGPIRNQQMIDEGKPDLVVAFPGGTGTADMIRRAKAAGIRVIEVGP